MSIFFSLSVFWFGVDLVLNCSEVKQFHNHLKILIYRISLFDVNHRTVKPLFLSLEEEATAAQIVVAPEPETIQFAFFHVKTCPSQPLSPGPREVKSTGFSHKKFNQQWRSQMLHLKLNKTRSAVFITQICALCFIPPFELCISMKKSPNNLKNGGVHFMLFCRYFQSPKNFFNHYFNILSVARKQFSTHFSGWEHFQSATFL